MASFGHCNMRRTQIHRYIRRCSVSSSRGVLEDQHESPSRMTTNTRSTILAALDVVCLCKLTYLERACDNDDAQNQSPVEQKMFRPCLNSRTLFDSTSPRSSVPDDQSLDLLDLSRLQFHDVLVDKRSVQFLGRDISSSRHCAQALVASTT